MSENRKTLQTDVLIIGGGLAGAVAALKAKENGADVLVLEKANTYRSGYSGSGIDHLYTYLPPIHEKVGYTKDMMKKDVQQLELMGLGIGDHRLTDYFVDHSYERIMELEKYGIRFRYEDSRVGEGLRIVPQFHSIPTSINFDGRDIKVQLTKAMKKAGVKIINHAQVVEILLDEEGAAAGAIAISTREDQMIVVEAKITVLTAASGIKELGDNFNVTQTQFEEPSSCNSGWGLTLAMNAGAEVVNLEFAINNGGVVFPGFNFTAGAPGCSWWPAARVVDEDGNVIVERAVDYDINDPDYRKKHTEQMELFVKQKAAIGKHLREGRQVYLDLSQATDTEIESIRWSLSNEGRSWLYIRNLDQAGIDLRKVKIPYKLLQQVTIVGNSTGVYTNTKAETNVKNLYAAGDIMGASGLTCAPTAVVYGYEAGIQAAAAAKKVVSYPKADPRQIRKIEEEIEKYTSAGEGENWKSVRNALRGIVDVFAIFPMSDKKIDTALKLIEKIKENPNLYAGDRHELTRCFEVRSLIESAEAIFTAARIRDKNLGPFKRYAEEDKEVYGLRVAPKGGVLPETKIYGIYRGKDQKLHYHTHIINKN